MTPVLVIRDADGSERTVELRDGVLRIGRAAGRMSALRSTPNGSKSGPMSRPNRDRGSIPETANITRKSADGA